MESTRHETVCGIALNAIFGYHPAAARAAVAHFGSPAAVFSQSPGTLDSFFGPYNKHRHLICASSLDAATEELERITRMGCRFIPMGSPGYPPLLYDCPDAPAGLYMLGGGEELFAGREAVSVIGTRDMSPYGREWTERIVYALSHAETKPMIVSGFAMGVDITAHLAALSCGLPTVAVLPVGIDDVYPRRHRSIAARMLEAGNCALITDFPPGTAPVPFNFLRRNRIIAGMSRATVLTESRLRGGGTMTARLAAGYGREVFCLPGRIDDARSAGCLRLLREKLAEPVTDTAELCAQMGFASTAEARHSSLEESVRRCYSGSSERMMLCLVGSALYVEGHCGATHEETAAALGLPPGEVSAALCMLEGDGFISTDVFGRCSMGRRGIRGF
ncbi:MAG: DNA-protecting protein DprA [Bacteroidales bacterium]|nr:DNA-protecting protein DprA [Bacteroidales bacterium]